MNHVTGTTTFLAFVFLPPVCNHIETTRENSWAEMDVVLGDEGKVSGNNVLDPPHK